MNLIQNLHKDPKTSKWGMNSQVLSPNEFNIKIHLKCQDKSLEPMAQSDTWYFLECFTFFCISDSITLPYVFESSVLITFSVKKGKKC